jgi:hypothetical protein
MSKEEIVVVVDFKDLKHLFFEEQVRDRNGLAIAPMKSPIEMAKAWINEAKINIPSDNAANGKAIITYILAAKTTLVITKLKVSATASQVISVAYGAALDGSQVDVDHTFLNAPQQWGELAEAPFPLIAIYNGTTSNINVYVYANTGSIMGVTNNPAAGAVKYGATLAGFTATDLAP